MNKFKDTLRSLFSTGQPIPAGMYHFQAPSSDPRNYRLHLRVEPDGSGILIVNAATVLHLNPTAAEYAFYLVQNMPAEQAVSNILGRYRVSREQAQRDYQDFVDRIDTLVTIPDLDPESFLDFERTTPYSGSITAPYRLDCALTYALPEETAGAAPTERVTAELNTTEWQMVLDKAWQAGIPHVVFTGGEPTLRPDLAKLIAHAENNNMVTGLLSDGLRLSDQAYLDELLQTGLDHLLMIFHHEDSRSWQALDNAIAADLFVAVHLTVTAENHEALPGLLVRLAEKGVTAVSLSASSPQLAGVLQELRERAAALDLELVWNLPVPYSALNPVWLEVEGDEYAQGAGRAWLYVEPDGDVLPAQGINQPLGNLLRDSWDAIWKKP